MQYLPDGASGIAQLMKTKQLALKAFGTQMAPAAHVQDKDLVLWRDFAHAQLMGTTALRVQPHFSLELVTPPPFEQSGFGDAATPTTQSRILTVFVMLHPAQPGFKDWFRIDHG